MNLDLAASLRTSFRVLWLLPSGGVNLIKKKSHSLSADWIGQNRSKAPCHGIDTHDASARRFLVEGGDDLCLEPPPGADIYLFSGAPVGGALKAADHSPLSQPWLGHGLSTLLDSPR